MKPRPECFSCFLRQALIASKLANASSRRQTDVQKSTMRRLLRTDWRENPPMIATRVFADAYRVLNCTDPYIGVKKEYNAIVRKQFPGLKRMMKAHRDPFTQAVKLALAGNIIDFGILEHIDLKKTLADTLAQPLRKRSVDRLKSAARRAGSILYIADNAGEIGFDYFLISELRRLNPAAEISLSIKGKPVINDATREDAAYFGLDRRVAVIDTGPSFVGTHVARSSAAFRRVFADADLVISKGQANWESLEELKDPRIVFLLRAKCPIVSSVLNVPLNQAVISHGR